MELESEQLKEPRRLDFSKDDFDANGNHYHFSPSLTLTRYREFEKVLPKVAYGSTLHEIYNEDLKIVEEINKGRYVQAGVIISNRANRMYERLQDRITPVVRLCCLFINRDGEDITTIDEKTMEEKATDWEKAGFDYTDFFRLAFNLVNNLVPVFETTSPNTSPEQGGGDAEAESQSRNITE
jgi:hypothetical protein